MGLGGQSYLLGLRERSRGWLCDPDLWGGRVQGGALWLRRVSGRACLCPCTRTLPESHLTHMCAPPRTWATQACACRPVGPRIRTLLSRGPGPAPPFPSPPPLPGSPGPHCALRGHQPPPLDTARGVRTGVGFPGLARRPGRGWVLGRCPARPPPSPALLVLTLLGPPPPRWAAGVVSPAASSAAAAPKPCRARLCLGSWGEGRVVGGWGGEQVQG